MSRDLYPAPESIQCDCCRNDVGVGEHDADCANRSLELVEIEALAAAAPIEAMFPDLQPLTPAMGQILSHGAQRVGAGSMGGAEQFRSAQDVGGAL